MKELFHSPILKLLLIATLLQSCYLQTAPQEDVCRFFSNNTKIRDPDSCTQYITCIDFISYYTKCTAQTPFYDKNTGKCVKSLDDQSSCKISCAGAAGQFLPDPKSCNGYFYCQDEEIAVNGKCADNLHFNPVTQSCIYTYESICYMAQFEVCSIVKDGIKFKDGTNCANYFVCTKGVASLKSCKPTEYFNPVTGECDQKSKVNCLKHPIPKGVCMGKLGGIVKYKMVADQATCRGYFYCGDKGDEPDNDPSWFQCPVGKFFNEKTQSCEHPLNTLCNWDRCEGRNLQFVSSTTKGCRQYLRCKNGISEGELSCGNKFFDEYQSVCISTVVSYPSCKI